MKKKILSSVLCLVMVSSMVVPAYATTVDTDSAEVSAALTTDALQFNITVPTTLTIDVDSDGITTVADNAEIVNNALAPIVVESVSVTGEDWAIVDYDTDFTEVKVNTKAFGMTLNDNEVAEDGTVSVESGFGVINGTDSLALDYEVTLALQSEETVVDIATLEFVFDWSYEEEPEVIEYTYTLTYATGVGTDIIVANMPSNYADTFTASTADIQISSITPERYDNYTFSYWEADDGTQYAVGELIEYSWTSGTTAVSKTLTAVWVDNT